MVELKDLEESFSRILGEKLKSQDKKEGEPMAFCPECLRKDNFAELTKRDHQQELREAKAETEKARELLDNVLKGHQHLTPELFKEWKNCPNCKSELGTLLKPSLDVAYQEGQQNPDAVSVGKFLKEKNLIGMIDGKPFKEIVIPKRGTK